MGPSVPSAKLRALMGLNGPKEPHLGPPPTPVGPGAYLSSASRWDEFLSLCCSLGTCSVCPVSAVPGWTRSCFVPLLCQGALMELFMRTQPRMLPDRPCW